MRRRSVPAGFGIARVGVAGTLDVGPGLRVDNEPVVSHFDVMPEGVLRIGRNVRIGAGFGLACLGAVTIGDDVVIGPYVQVLDSDLHEAGRHEVRPRPRPVVIGEGAVVGAWTMILPGTALGAGCVVAPCSVVSGVVSAGELVGGNPAVTLSAGVRETAGDASDLVRQALAEVFNVEVRPELGVTRSEIPGWDSLGALRLLDMLERSAGRSLPETAVLTAKTVASLVDAVRSGLVD